MQCLQFFFTNTADYSLYMYIHVHTIIVWSYTVTHTLTCGLWRPVPSPPAGGYARTQSSAREPEQSISVMHQTDNMYTWMKEIALPILWWACCYVVYHLLIEVIACIINCTINIDEQSITYTNARTAIQQHTVTGIVHVYTCTVTGLLLVISAECMSGEYRICRHNYVVKYFCGYPWPMKIKPISFLHKE